MIRIQALIKSYWVWAIEAVAERLWSNANNVSTQIYKGSMSYTYKKRLTIAFNMEFWTDYSMDFLMEDI